MAKKKQPAAAEATTIDTTAALERGEQGYGALPGIQHNANDMTIAAAQGKAAIDQLAAQGCETEVVTLRDAARAQAPTAVDALAELDSSTGSAAGWQPQAPEGDGWLLVAVLRLAGKVADAVAVWARQTDAATATAQAAGPNGPDSAQAHAAAFLVGNLMQAAKRRFTELAVPWRQLSEAEQSRTLKYLAEDVRVAVGAAIRAIASNERTTFRAEVESVNFKGATDVKAVLKMVASQEAHGLADVAGGFVTVIIEDTADLLSIPDAATADEPDNGSLFDASTEGTALDAQPDAVGA